METIQNKYRELIDSTFCSNKKKKFLCCENRFQKIQKKAENQRKMTYFFVSRYSEFYFRKKLSCCLNECIKSAFTISIFTFMNFFMKNHVFFSISCCFLVLNMKIGVTLHKISESVLRILLRSILTEISRKNEWPDYCPWPDYCRALGPAQYPVFFRETG